MIKDGDKVMAVSEDAKYCGCVGRVVIGADVMCIVDFGVRGTEVMATKELVKLVLP